MNQVSYGLALQELEYGDSGLRSFVSVQGALCMYPIFRFGTEEQRKKYLPKMAAGELIGCFGLTEPDAGSDPGAMKTTARKDGDGYILHGAKMWITNSPIADLCIVWAKLDGDDGKSVRGLRDRTRHEGPRLPDHAPQDVAARFAHRRDHDGRGARCRRRRCCPRRTASDRRWPA